MNKEIIGIIAAIAALIGTPALAADMALPPPPPPEPFYNWTGFYLGGEGGVGWFSNKITNVTGGPSFPPGFVHNSDGSEGPFGGGYGGFNYQFNHFVVGIDGDFSGADLKGTAFTTGPHGNIDRDTDRINWLATATGRVGYAFDNVLLFAKGGWAAASFNGTETNFTAALATAASGTNASTRNGWTVGAGVEYGLTPHWSAKLEYDYLQLGTAAYNTTLTNTGVGGGSPPGTISVFARSATSSLNLVKAGFAYRF
jgi:outer membrane immunogenic protein